MRHGLLPDKMPSYKPILGSIAAFTTRQRASLSLFKVSDGRGLEVMVAEHVAADLACVCLDDA